ncbi:Staphopain B precursor [Staphylococcus aureus]|nr:Staphopain B precursor [Staphylococcus aureus]
MAALLNATKNTDTYNAHDIMRTLYPEVSEQDLPNCATFPNQMIEYGKSQGRDIHYQKVYHHMNKLINLQKIM